MKIIYSIKIRNSLVFTNFLSNQLEISGFDVSDTYISDFNFCPWLVIYYDNGPKIQNYNNGFYENIKNNDNFIVNEAETVEEFLSFIKKCNKPTITLF